MRFAESIWLFGMLGALGLGLLLSLTAFRQSRALASFAQKAQLDVLVTSRPTIRRTLAGILLVAAVALAFLAAASPQYGKGTRILPRTNLDVVIVLDFSKSMYARDISPSRIERSKIEVQRLVQKLAGARFGAVAFAGEPMAFPLTSDGAAIAQFFVGLSPNDMPVGGTSTARALEAGRQLLLRDPLAKNHEQVMVLITDGEDLEGDPVASARSAQEDGIRVSVVQIGGQSPEPIPDIDDHGQSRGFRKDSRGKPLTTHLSEDGERQLEEVASAGQGTLVKAGKGDTGIDEMAESLRKRMTDELSERVETVYADVFQYPLGLAVLLLTLEVFVGLGRHRPKVVEPPRNLKRKRRLKRLQMQSALLLFGVFGCQPYEQLFERESPLVEEAIAALSTGETARATELLTKYLETGECQEGVIGVGARGRRYPDASFDLGLAFASDSGKKPTNPPDPKAPQAPPGAQLPGAQLPGLGLPGAPPTPNAPPGAPAAPPGTPPAQLDCALRLLAPIADAESESAGLRARAFYLMGNIEANRQNYDAAVAAYTKGLRLVPGAPEAQGDPIGRDLAHNHAVALKLLEEKKKQEEEQKKNEEKKDDQKSDDDKKDEDKKDKSEEPKKDEEKKDDQKSDDDKKDEDKKDKSEEPKKDEEKKDDQKSDDDKKDEQAKQDEQKESAPERSEPQAPSQPENRPSVSQDERVLDQLEQSPTLQQHTARQNAGTGRSGMEDK